MKEILDLIYNILKWPIIICSIWLEAVLILSYLNLNPDKEDPSE